MKEYKIGLRDEQGQPQCVLCQTAPATCNVNTLRHERLCAGGWVWLTLGPYCEECGDRALALQPVILESENIQERPNYS